MAVLSYFEGSANVPCYPSCTLTTLHWIRGSSLQGGPRRRYNNILVTHVKELLDSYTPGKENLGETSSDLKIRLKLCSRDKPNFYTLCKKNRRRRGGGGRAARRGPTPSEDEGVGRHICSQCGKRFSHASSLARHQQTHRGGGKLQHQKLPPPAGRSKTFTCAACSKTFMHSSSFSRHKKAHLEEEQRHAAARRRKRPALDETAPLESDSE
ncbi:zinc finger protein 672 [Eleginops maclovinus]|uniref:zinc finger protein 672 n=1 Tax=Eleginops maclovinus TaxID=56733 RepID=UPI00307FE1B9